MKRRVAAVIAVLAATAAIGVVAMRAEPSAACAALVGEAGPALHAPALGPLADRFEAALPACSRTPGFEGWAADVFARAGRIEGARTHADAAIARDPRDVHAMFALAMLAQGTPDAVRIAERADAAGYGDDATLLVGVADLEAGDAARAAESFRRVLAHDPTHVAATYDLALAADRQGNYHDAREGYLAALHLDPHYADARYNLALLTYRAGALPEARHHADELAAIAPDDPRLPALRSTLGRE